MLRRRKHEKSEAGRRELDGISQESDEVEARWNRHYEQCLGLGKGERGHESERKGDRKSIRIN